MNTSLYVGYAGLSADLRALEHAAHNVANVSTNGFREERAFVDALEAAGTHYPRVGGTQASTLPGPLVATGAKLDLAIEGQGFLVVDTPAGRRYTRDGGLSMDKEGTLVTKDGLPVLGQGGRITLSPGDIEIDPEGRIAVEGVQSGRLLLVDLDPATLSRESGGLYRSSSATEAPANDSRLKQGFVEKSNVGLPSRDAAALQRHFQSLSRAMTTVTGLERRLISTVRGQ